MISRVVFNKKGGVGKTTITCNLAAISAEAGVKTLVIDLDPQANASKYLLGEEYDKTKERGETILEFYRASLEANNVFAFNPFLSHLGNSAPKAEDFIKQTAFANLSIIASHPELLGLENQLAAKHKIYKLKEMLEKLTEYQAVFIDTPPAMNFFSQSALIAASRCLIPFDCDDFSKDAIFEVGKHIAAVQNDHNQALRVEGIVVNQFMARAKYPREAVLRLQQEGLPILDSMLSASVKIRESHHHGQPLIHYSPDHKLTREYQALYREINP